MDNIYYEAEEDNAEEDLDEDLDEEQLLMTDDSDSESTVVSYIYVHYINTSSERSPFFCD